MATHSSVLAWRIPGMGEPGGLLSLGSHRVGHDWSDLAAAAAAGDLMIRTLCFHCCGPRFDPGFPGGSDIKESACNAGHPGSIPGLGRSPGEGNGTPLQYSCLENPVDGGAWWAAVHGVPKSPTRLSNFTFTFHFNALEKEMATHSSVLAWRIPGMGEPGGLPSMGSHRVGHDWSDSAAAATAEQLIHWELRSHKLCDTAKK